MRTRNRPNPPASGIASVLLKITKSFMAVAGIVLLVGGGIGVASGVPGGVPATLFGLILCVGALVEQTRYKKLETTAPPAPFEPTGERFTDPATKAKVTVYADPATGERKYVRE